VPTGNVEVVQVDVEPDIGCAAHVEMAANVEPFSEYWNATVPVWSEPRTAVIVTEVPAIWGETGETAATAT
jgi:hypothetical protein